jgi:hypothetical protein
VGFAFAYEDRESSISEWVAAGCADFAHRCARPEHGVAIMRGIFSVVVILAVGCAAGALLGQVREPEPKKEPAKKPEKKTVKELMGRKLEHSQKLLSAQVTNDLDKAGREAEALIRVRKEVAWMIYKTKDYDIWSNEFNTSAEKIVKASKEKNLDVAKLAYLEMTMTCFHCHTYVRDLGDIQIERPREE